MNSPGTSERNSLLQLARSDWVFGCSLAAGIILRLYQIRKQIPADDEWHGLSATLHSGYASIVTHFGGADRSIPLAAFYELLSHTIGLSEMAMRFLPLACGIAALVVIPAMFGFVVGQRTGRIAGALLALSPLHIYFSRYARPYSITMLIASVGVLAAYLWWTGADPRWRRVYIACAIIGPYFHLVVVPILLSPLLFILLWRVLLGSDRTQIRFWEVVAAGSAVAAGLGLLLFAPLLLDLRSLAGKVGKSQITWNSVNGAWHLLAGSNSDAFVVSAAALCLAGAVIVMRRNFRLAAFVIFVAFCQAAFPVVTKPAVIDVPIVLARYMFSALPLLMLLAAVALEYLERVLPLFDRYLPGMFVVGVLLLQFFAGPLPSTYYFPNNWTNHGIFQYYYKPAGQNPYEHILRVKTIPDFYRQLKSHPPGSVSLVEAPWYYEWHNIHYPYYQQVHRQWMYIGLVDENDFNARMGELPRALPRYWFRNFVHVSDLAGLRYRHINYVIFHKDLAHEMPLATRPVVDVSKWVEHYRRLFGAPVFEDRWIVVFDVQKLRISN